MPRLASIRGRPHEELGSNYIVDPVREGRYQPLGTVRHLGAVAQPTAKPEAKKRRHRARSQAVHDVHARQRAGEGRCQHAPRGAHGAPRHQLRSAHGQASAPEEAVNRTEQRERERKARRAAWDLLGAIDAEDWEDGKVRAAELAALMEACEAAEQANCKRLEEQRKAPRLPLHDRD